MAGKLNISEVKLISPNGLVEKTITVDNNGIVTIDAVNPLEKTLFKEYTVTGSATTSIDITGLDINTHKSYRVEFEPINPTASNSNIYMFANGDTTLTNYWMVTSSDTGHTNRSDIGYMWANSVTSMNGKVSLVNSRFSYVGTLSMQQTTVDNLVRVYGTFGTPTISNITQLTISSSVSNAFAVGTKVRIYRGDL